MENLTGKYRISIYEEVTELSEDKIYLVKSSLDDKIYIKKILPIENYKIYKEIKKLDITNIPKIYEIIEDGDKVVIVEEYINGFSLKEILDQRQILSETEVIGYTLDLIKILEDLYSGDSHIIHRDIKPSNIMINNDGILKLIDFDISRVHKTDKSTDTYILGTYGYAAPEQFGFNQSDIRTDIYSIGATMNTLLTGKLPVEKIYKGDLSKIISKCIELDPDNRFQNFSKLKSELLKKQKKYNIKNGKHGNLNLPGFNSNRLIFKIIALLWYGILIMGVIGLFDEGSVSNEKISNIGLALFFFLLTLLYGNYKNIKLKLPIVNSTNLLIKLIGYIIYTVILIIIFSITLIN